MIGLLSKVNIIDNSGGLVGRCIKILKKSRAKLGEAGANIGDIIIVSVIKTYSSDTNIKKGDIHKALIVRTKKLNNNVRWTTNSVILIKGNNKTEIQPIGTRIKGPISTQINNLKIMSLAKLFF